MSLKTTCAILASFLWLEICAGQTADFKNGNPFSSVFSGSDSGFSAPSFSQDFSSSAPLNKENNYQVPSETRSSFLQPPFLPSEPSSTIGSTSEISPISYPSPVESFVSEFTSEVHASKTLPIIFDLSDLSPEDFSKSLYDYVYGNSLYVSHGDPHYIASLVADPIKEGIDKYTLPIMLDIYGNDIGKYLFSKGILDSSNASSLAKKFAKTVEDIAERKWAKDTLESKFLVLEDSYIEYLKSMGHFTLDTIEDLALLFANEVKRVAANSKNLSFVK